MTANRRLKLRIPVGVVVGFVALTGALRGWNAWLDDAPNLDVVPTKVRISGTRAEALTADDHPVWSHDFSVSIEQVKHSIRASDWNPRIDIDGDGHDEFLVAVRFSIPYPTIGQDAVVAFDRRGHRLWTAGLGERLPCLGSVSAGSWQLSAVASSAETGQRRLWTAFSDYRLSRSVVLEVNQYGRSRVVYAQSGAVSALSVWQMDGKPILVAGGTFGNLSRPSLVFFDRNAEYSQPPKEYTHFSCGEGGASEPLQMMLLPQHEAEAVEQRPPNDVTALWQHPEYLRSEQHRGRTLALIDGRGEVLEYVLTDAYWAWHDAASRGGRIKHTAEACPERAPFWTVDVWKPTSGWKAVAIGRPQ